jgi:hypothetical protein
MNFESELSAKQPSDHLSNVSNNNSNTAHNACASDKPCHITKKCGRKVCLNRVELQQNTYPRRIFNNYLNIITLIYISMFL